MSLYNLRSLTADSFMIAKFDEDFNVEATYTLTASRNGHYTCDCPAGSRSVVTKPCRHRLMLPALLPAVDTDQFYDHDTGKFCEPLGDLLRPTADLAGQEELPEGMPKLTGLQEDMILMGFHQPELVGEALRPLQPSEALSIEPEQNEGEAPPSSTCMPDAIVGNQMIELKTTPTIRRR